jgi:hypothetical protein
MRRSIHADPRGKRVANLVAAAISKTYAECGEAAVLADDTALTIIRDILLEFDEEIIKRNTKNRFIKRFIKNATHRLITGDRQQASGDNFNGTE